MPILEERLHLSDDRLKQIEDINQKVTRVGASLGIEQFKEELRAGVNIRDVGDNFSGNIAGGDIADTINKLTNQVGDLNQFTSTYKQQMAGIVGDSARLMGEAVGVFHQVIDRIRAEHGPHEYAVQLLFDRNPDTLVAAITNLAVNLARESWSLFTVAPAYRDFDGCVAIFRRTLERG